MSKVVETVDPVVETLLGDGTATEGGVCGTVAVEEGEELGGNGGVVGGDAFYAKLEVFAVVVGGRCFVVAETVLFELLASTYLQK